MDSSFTDAEKRFVLAEMIKVSHLDIGTLVDFVKTKNVQPDWLSMQVPGGRNMNQCIRACEVMFNAQLHHPRMPIQPLKRKSVGDDFGEHVPKRLAISPVEPPQQQLLLQQQQQPLPHPHPHSHPHAPQHQAAPMAFPRNVNIQPRPSPNGYPPPPIASSPTVPSAGSTRKRGRPSKAEKEAQARANASSSSSNYVHVAPLPSLAPQPAPSTPAFAHASSPESGASVLPPAPSSSYQIASGPMEMKSTRRGRGAPDPDKAQPRALPEARIEHPERSPSVANLISPPTESDGGGGRPAVQDSPAMPSIITPQILTAPGPVDHTRDQKTPSNNHNQTPVQNRA